MKRIYVGNLPPSADQESIRVLFAAHGEVHAVNLIMDRDTGEPRGFAFVEMDDEEAMAAITALDDTPVDGQNLRVNEARERGAGRNLLRRGPRRR